MQRGVIPIVILELFAVAVLVTGLGLATRLVQKPTNLATSALTCSDLTTQSVCSAVSGCNWTLAYCSDSNCPSSCVVTTTYCSVSNCPVPPCTSGGYCSGSGCSYYEKSECEEYASACTWVPSCTGTITTSCSGIYYTCTGSPLPTATPKPTATPTPQPTSVPVSTPTPIPCPGNCLSNTYLGQCAAPATSFSCPLNYYCCLDSLTPTPTIPAPTYYPGQNCEEIGYKCVTSTLTCNLPSVSSDCPVGEKCVPNTAVCTGPSPTPSPAPTIAPPTPYPTATPTPLPSPTPQPICIPGSTRCIDPAVNSPDPAQLLTCDSVGAAWTYSVCPNDYYCNFLHTACEPPLILSAASIPECDNYDTKCESGRLFTCIAGEWNPNIDSSICPSPTPTPTIVVPVPTVSNISCTAEGGTCYPDSYLCQDGNPLNLKCPSGQKCYDGGQCYPNFCPTVNGYAFCTQTNPVWANNGFPLLCATPELNHYANAACGQSATCSLLCQYLGPQYCDLRKCMDLIYDYHFTSCSGTPPWLHHSVLDRLLAQQVTLLNPDLYFDNETNEFLSPPLLSRDSIIRNLYHGPILVYGYFSLKTDPINIITHFSTIVGINSDGKFIYNDPFFNSGNPYPVYRINSPILEDYLNIKILSATVIHTN